MNWPADPQPSHGPRTASFVPLVQREIERLIGSGELDSGARINESAIALKLGISRGPVREACRSLEQRGLLRSELNRGFFVREIGLKEALDIYEARASLFAMAGRLAAPVVSARQLDFLVDLITQMDRTIEADDLAGFYPLNNEFHARVVEFADNTKLSELWPALEAELYLFRRRGLVLPGSMRVSNDEHRSIVDALRRGDGAGAARLMEGHILAGKGRLLRTLDRAPMRSDRNDGT